MNRVELTLAGVAVAVGMTVMIYLLCVV